MDEAEKDAEDEAKEEAQEEAEEDEFDKAGELPSCSNQSFV